MYRVYYYGEELYFDEVAFGTGGTGDIFMKFRPSMKIDGQWCDSICVGSYGNEDYDEWALEESFSVFLQYLDSIDGIIKYKVKRGSVRFTIDRQHFGSFNDICQKIRSVFKRCGFDVFNDYTYEGTDGNYWYLVRSRFWGNWAELEDS